MNEVRADRSRVEVAGINACYTEMGSGPKILMLHGGRLGYSADAWAEVSNLLAERACRAIAVDLPGYGYTDNPSDYSFAYGRYFLQEFVEKVTGPVTVVGHSNSGSNVVRLGLEHPELVQSVVIAGTGPLMPVNLALAAALRRDLASEEELSEPTIEETRSSFLPDVHNPEVLTPDRLANLNGFSSGKNLEAARQRRAADAGNREADRGDIPLWQRLDELQMLVLAIFGEGDKNLAATRLPMMAEKYPEIETHLLAECRHTLQWDQPLIVAELMAEFVHKVAKGRA
jgi:pimeloyl-ACP methyl ester carboxylesterase